MNLDDTPTAMIARLDASLARRGQTCKLRRRIGDSETNFVDVTVRARVSGYAAEQIVGAVRVTDSKFTMSPSEIVAAGAAWPGAAGKGEWPIIGDFLVVNEHRRRIEQVQPVVIGGVVVRIEGRVAG